MNISDPDHTDQSVWGGALSSKHLFLSSHTEKLVGKLVADLRDSSQQSRHVSCDPESSDTANRLQVVIGNRNNLTEDKEEREYPVRKTIRRTNIKVQVAKTLPIVSVANIRSLVPKIVNYKNDLKERKIHLSILSEVWE